jgi:2-(1,2-epoxy-1,2-dihydrophenyl)acetyl-CoA isomerase
MTSVEGDGPSTRHVRYYIQEYYNPFMTGGSISMAEGLRLEISNRVARLTFDRPETRNALSQEIVLAFADALRQLEDDPDVCCIVISGAGEHFIGGGDVKAFGTTLTMNPLERKHEFERRVSSAIGAFSLLERIGKPTIARVRGAVAGAGIPFVLACDFAVAGESSFFLFAHRTLSLPPDGGLSYFLPRIVGWRRAKQLTLLGARMDSMQALEEGVITQRVPDVELDAACDALIAKLIDGPPIGARATKQLLNESFHNGIAEQLRREAVLVGECVATADFEEGVRAFLEKRRPKFSGR